MIISFYTFMTISFYTFMTISFYTFMTIFLDVSAFFSNFAA